MERGLVNLLSILLTILTLCIIFFKPIIKFIHDHIDDSVRVYFSPTAKQLCVRYYNELANKPAVPKIKTIGIPHCLGAPKCKFWHPGPGEDSCEFVIARSLSSARCSVYLCIYRLSYEKFTDILIQMRLKGVEVRLVVDQSNEKDDREDGKGHHVEVLRLIDYGVKVKTPKFESSEHNPNGYGLMHNKYVIIDNGLLISGSLNWTYNGLMRNYEFISVSSEKNTVRQFNNNFAKIWSEAIPYRRRT